MKRIPPHTLKLSRVCFTGLVAAVSLMAANAFGQTWPSKPIRLIAPQAAGGGPERVIRAVTQGLSQRLGQPVVVDYKAGAAGNIGTGDLARSAPDGYTWMLGPENPLTINPFIYKSIGFNRQDVAPFNLFGSLNQILACHPKVGAKTLQDLTRIAKAGKLTYASSGAGSVGQLTMEMLLDELGVQMTHVPYRGPGPAVQDLLGGQVDCTFIVTAALVEHVKSKALVGIATSSQQRIAAIPDVPTMKEVGVPNFEGNFWLGVFAPRGVPKDIQEKFGKALDEVIRSPEVREAMAVNNTVFVGTSPEVAQAEIAKATQRWEKVVKRLNISLD
jgi:tripartite-type tricarboxylate transporter receptor subunit TctC